MMKYSLVLLFPLTLTACGPHVYVKEPYHVEVASSGLVVDHVDTPDYVDDGGDNGQGSSDDNGDMSSDDSNGDNSDD